MTLHSVYTTISVNVMNDLLTLVFGTGSSKSGLEVQSEELRINVNAWG